MNIRPETQLLFKGWAAIAWVSLLFVSHALAQWPFPPVTTPDAQRNAMSVVRSRIGWVENATKTAPNYGPNGYANIWQQFQGLRAAYENFKQTLTPQQRAAGANSLAELDAGLDIIQEAFANYENDWAAGRSAAAALRDLCRVMRDGTRLWWHELNKTCASLRVGRI